MTLAERLIDLAAWTRHPRSELIVATEAVGENVYARIKLALDFDGLPPATKFASIVEGWDRQRILLEVYR